MIEPQETLPEQPTKLGEQIAKLEEQKSQVNAGDVFSFGYTAALTGLILKNISDTMLTNSLDARANLASMIIDAKHHGRLEENLAQIIGKQEVNQTIVNTLSSGINDDSFANLTSLLSNGASKHYNNDILNYLHENFPGQVNGAIVAGAALVGLTVAACYKMQHNQVTDAQIASLQPPSETPRNRVTEAQMTQLRQDIEKIPSADVGKYR